MEPSRSYTLADLGWTPQRASQAETGGLVPGRVSAAHGASYVVLCETGELEAFPAARLKSESSDAAGLPAPGDWVMVESGERPVIHRVLPRTSKLSRKAAGGVTAEQLVAANVDIVFIVAGLDGDYNPRRVERMCVAVWDSGARPVVVLSKADRCEDAPDRVEEMETSVPGVPVHALSCLLGTGTEQLDPYLRPGVTIALLGSSGVGKSTLVNRLAGEELFDTGENRAHDSRGRHTTTHREMVRLPSGAWLIDGPGVRELQLWDGDAGLQRTFGDIESLAESCRFKDCSHGTEPGCAVKGAVETGKLTDGRLSSYRKLEREVRFQARRQDQKARLDEKRRHKVLTKRIRQMQKSGWA